MAEQVLDGVFDITIREDPHRFRTYLVDGEVPTLFDTGFADTADRLISSIEKLGIDPERVILTHEDHDHVGGLDAIVDRFDPELWAPAADAAAVESETGVVPDHEYGHGESIGRYTAVHAPGHTPGCSVLIDEHAGFAVTGDVLVGADLRGLPAGYLVPPAEVFSDDVAQAERSLDRLLDYEFDAALVYHGSSVLEGASDRLRAYVDFPGKP